jgi:hypothetical protein
LPLPQELHVCTQPALMSEPVTHKRLATIQGFAVMARSSPRKPPRGMADKEGGDHTNLARRVNFKRDKVEAARLGKVEEGAEPTKRGVRCCSGGQRLHMPDHGSDRAGG